MASRFGSGHAAIGQGRGYSCGSGPSGYGGRCRAACGSGGIASTDLLGRGSGRGRVRFSGGRSPLCGKARRRYVSLPDTAFSRRGCRRACGRLAKDLFLTSFRAARFSYFCRGGVSPFSACCRSVCGCAAGTTSPFLVVRTHARAWAKCMSSVLCFMSLDSWWRGRRVVAGRPHTSLFA